MSSTLFMFSQERVWYNNFKTHGVSTWYRAEDGQWPDDLGLLFKDFEFALVEEVTPVN